MKIYNKIIFFIFTLIFLMSSISFEVFGKDLDHIIDYDDVVLEKYISNYYVLTLPTDSDRGTTYSIYYKKHLTDSHWNLLQSSENPCENLYGIGLGDETMLFIGAPSINIEDYNIMVSVNKNKDVYSSNINKSDEYFFYSPQLNSPVKDTNATIFNYKRIFDSNYIWNITLDYLIKDTEDIKITLSDSNIIQDLSFEIDKDNENILIIHPPKGDYKLNENYTMKIDMKFSKKAYFQSFRYVNKKDNNWFEEYLKNNVSGVTDIILDYTEDYKVQILYTEVTRDKNGLPYFDSYSYKVDDESYFYPASSIKLSSCLLSLEKLNNLNIEGLDMYSTMHFDDLSESSVNQKGNSVYDNIKKILLYSDNSSYNTLYELLGQNYYNEALKEHGYNNTNIIHRLSGKFSNKDNKYSSKIVFLDKKGDTLYVEPSKYNTNNLFNIHPKGLTVGSMENKNFSRKNYSSIKDLQGMMAAVIFNDYFKNEYKFNLSNHDLTFLRKYLEKTNHKYLLYGGDPPSNKENIHMLNKYGMAYGFMIDNGYFYDEISKKEFLLTAVIYANENGYLDGRYEYNSKSIPFLKEIGKVVLDYNSK
ncbi:serine hydrolase [Oceanirhabdus sp. W0125-5]|uniref:serine hydrolase n=1 Tax=Oceanirhabdus sp. W0125-5 TaxID=2999116 RepID=UPI0022F32B1A|nr:serine hydrolase [Oceanirhabdus sp. W0125-5]WBW98389.1 serine hydrolase [Oceanirhabdus sp. W0125-5]